MDTYVVIYLLGPAYIRTAKLLKSAVTRPPLFYCALSHVQHANVMRLKHVEHFSGYFSFTFWHPVAKW